MKKKKQFKKDAPNEEWFWKNRKAVWKLLPDMQINHYNKKEDTDEETNKTQ